MKSINNIVKETINNYGCDFLIIDEFQDKILIQHKNLFKITFFNIEKKITINSEWKLGLLGQVFFKREYVLMNHIISDLIKKLESNGVVVNTLYKNVLN